MEGASGAGTGVTRGVWYRHSIEPLADLLHPGSGRRMPSAASSAAWDGFDSPTRSESRLELQNVPLAALVPVCRGPIGSGYGWLRFPFLLCLR